MRKIFSHGLTLAGACCGVALFLVACAPVDDTPNEAADEATSDETIGSVQEPTPDESIDSAQQAISSQCAKDIVLCGTSAGLFGLACAADIWAGGALTPACAAAFSAAGGACANAAGSCVGGGTLDTRRLARVGSAATTAPDYSVIHNCPGSNRVYKEKVEWFINNDPTAGSGRVSRITMTCTDGTTLTFGHAGGTSSNTYTCASGRLMNGELIQAGAEIDAAGGVCRNVTTNDPTTYINGIWGGSTGSRQDKVCPLGEFMFGAKVHMDGPNETQPNLLGIELNCR